MKPIYVSAKSYQPEHIFIFINTELDELENQNWLKMYLTLRKKLFYHIKGAYEEFSPGSSFPPPNSGKYCWTLLSSKPFQSIAESVFVLNLKNMPEKLRRYTVHTYIKCITCCKNKYSKLDLDYYLNSSTFLSKFAKTIFC